MNSAVESTGKSTPRAIGKFLLKHNTVVIFLLLVIISSFLSDSFLTIQNIFNVLRQQAPYMVIAIGMLIVLLTGGIDLAAGSVAAMGGMFMSLMINKWGFDTLPLFFAALVITLLVGAVSGLFAGVFVSIFNMAPFIVTLAVSAIARGVAYIFTSGQPVRVNKSIPSGGFLAEFGSGTITGNPTGIPWAIVLVVVLIAVFFYLLKYTAFGRLIISTGSNEDAVRLAGISVRRYKISVYVICSVLSVLAGIMVCARTAVANANACVGYELDAIAGCVIGGTSLSGGKGSVIFTIIGVLTLGLIGNIMNLMSIPPYPQQVIKGIIIIAAVLLQQVTAKTND